MRGSFVVDSLPTALPQTPRTTSISPHGCPTTVTHIRIVLGRSPRRRLRDLCRDLLHLLLEPALHTPRAIPPTTRAIRAASIIARPRTAIAPSPRANGNGQTLDCTAGRSLAWSLAGEHAVVDGEVAADHVGFLGGAVAGECFGGVGHFGRVFAVVDADFAVVTVAVAVGLVERVGPLAALAHACGVKRGCQSLIEEAHRIGEAQHISTMQWRLNVDSRGHRLTGQVHRVEHVGSNQD